MSSINPPIRSRKLLPLAFLIVTTAVLPSICNGQIGGIETDPLGNVSGNGIHRIEGRIYYPSGRQFDRHAKVRLRGATKGDLFATSDTNGAFTFRRLPVGDYEITVDVDPEFEPASESVLVLKDTALTVTVDIRLRLANETTNPTNPGIPRAARDLYERALLSAKASDHKKAVDELEKAIAIYPQFVLGLNELGIQYMMVGEFDKSAEKLLLALKLAPDAFVLHLNYGILLVQRKQYKEAEAELRRALAVKESAAALLHLGRALISLNRYDEAAASLEKAIKLGGREVDSGHRYLGAIYIELGKKELAIAELEEYLHLVPKARDASQIRDILKGLRDSISNGK